MPTFTRKPAEFPQGQVEGLSTGGEAFGASFAETWATGPTGAADMFQQLRASEGLSIGERVLDPLLGIESRKLSPMVTPDDAKQRVKDAGLEGQIPLSQYPNGMRLGTLQILIDANTAKVRRQTILQQADGWAPQLGGMLIGSIIDPINVASAFIPVVGEVRYAQLLARAGTVIGRAGVRVGVGSVEGAAGAAVVEPLIYAGQQQWRSDYDAYESLLNIAGGAGFGALLHGSAGLVKDVFGRPIAPELPRRAEAAVETVPRADELAPSVPAAEPTSRPMQAIPDEFIAKTKGGEWRLSDTAPVAGYDNIREVVAYDGEKRIGSLLYANDGTPPTVDVDPAYQRKGVATAMLKLAKERGGVLGDAQVGIEGVGTTYRTDEGQAFRASADESSVQLSPRMAEVAPEPAPRATGSMRQRTGTQAAEFIDRRIAELEARSAGHPDEARISTLREEDAALVARLRQSEGAQGVLVRPELRLAPDQLVEVTGRRLTIRQELESARAGRDYAAELAKLRSKLDKIDSDSALIALADDIAPLPQDFAVRDFITQLDPQTQANALRQALAQDVQGRPIDVTPAMLADPKFRADPAAHQESMARAAVNSQQMASADPQASIVAEQKIAATPQKASALEQAKQALADDEARYREGGGDPAAVEADEGDSKMIRDAVKAATLCMMRSGA